ncbi:heterogeneous nuclear ribonucleoprotein 1-like [Lycium ferocissimum]|uniref:heterogeneous nuclear ribonucleoprotein 1-like n=1 Tax=Lycium ferocissimum TaxID=112874 RepID=UPI002815C2E1|nr:heterogeneous nuclear ribonucleoprotein 1-like [Lycium ferocissimum]XP_059303079.1 heterogeneous nuclear ribonucleoprotein 1-like [Lycium ferocissimum]XP_059303080.1 heterogeneous nuclear ribonucleoprotein 1-like [Lycium ferocissimum]
MDYDVAEQNVAVYGDNTEEMERNDELKPSIDDSSAGKLFVGGIAWETREESFRKYFSRFGEITDCVIMMDKISGRPRGFGFVTFADPEVANKVLEEDHVIDGRTVEVKRTVPKEDMQVKGAPKTKKIFVGGLPISLTEDELKEYFSSYGYVLEQQIMLDRETGRSRGFGFVTFDSEDAVEKVLNNGRMHEISGKQVEIKRAEPKRAGAEHANESRQRRGGSGSRSYNGFGGSEGGGFGGYGGRMGRGYGGGYGGYSGGSGGGGYGGYGNMGASYGGGGGYGGYGNMGGSYGGYGYGFGFSGPMYGAAGYGGASYGAAGSYGGPTGYAGGRGYTSGDDGSWYGGAKGSVSFNAKGYDTGGSSGGAKAYGNGGAAGGRFHPYRN